MPEVQDPRASELLFHYTSTAKLGMILHSGRLRLTPYADTRDPRENQKWFPSLWARAEAEELTSTEERDVIRANIDHAVRNRTKIACLTSDGRDDDPMVNRFARGFARARMWEQYADLHRGAVIVFDRAALDQAVREQLGSRGALFSGAVRYADDEWDRTRVLSFDVEEVLHPEGLARAVDAVVAQHHRTLFFSKNTDWATEQEYRYVILTDGEYEEVTVASSVVELILGMDFPEHETSVLRHRLSRIGIPDIPVRQMGWGDGLPFAFPTDI